MIILLIGIVAVIAGFYFTNQTSQKVILEAKSNHISNNKNRVQEAMSVIFQTQQQFVKDYSLWDDMARAVEHKDLDWISSEFYGPLEIYDADAVWVFDNKGELLFHDAEKFASTHQKNILLPLSFTDLQKVQKNENQVTTFFSSKADETISYHISEIRYHSEKLKSEKVFGYIVVAVEWNDDLTQKLENLLQADIQIHTQPEEMQIKSQDNTVVYELFDHQGVATSHIVVSFFDTSISLLTKLINKQFVSILISSLISLFIGLLLIHKLFIKPINTVLNKLNEVENQPGLSNRFNQSELDTLTQLIDKYSEQIKINNKLSKAVTASTDAIIMTNKKGSIEYVNPAWEQLNGYTLSEVIGKNPKILKSGLTKNHTYTLLWKHLTNASPYSTEHIINKRKDGSLYAAQVSVFPVTENNQVSYFVGICRDISQRKARERLMSEFVSLASHQMRTPLTVMRWSLELFKTEARQILSDKNKKLILTLEKNVKRMIHLVNRLLNLSRIENGRLNVSVEELSLQNFISHIQKEIEPFVKHKKLKLSIDYATHVKKIVADKELLNEVFVNLFSNAIKYTPENGTVSCKITSEHDFIYCTISDTGIGIPKNEIKKLFTRFFRASNAVKKDTQGSGLGLYLVKLLIEVMGGSIAIKSKIDAGTQVTISIPIKSNSISGEIGIDPSSLP